MATILAHIKIKEGRERDFETVDRALYEATHAKETRVRRYEYWRGAEPRSYYSLLSFDDFLGFLEHQTSDHHESASPDLGALIEGMKLEWVDPISGASELAPTDMQDLPSDSDELTRRYHQMYAAILQDWWHALRKPA